MPNFTATLRQTYRDISGLIVSCGRADIEEDLANPGFIKRWRNRAGGLPSLPSPRVPADVVDYAGGRFGDFTQLDPAHQPELAVVLGQRKVKFNRADETYLQATIPGDFPYSAHVKGATCAFQYEVGTDPADDQVLYDDGQAGGVRVYRRLVGDAKFKIGATTNSSTTDLVTGHWLVQSDGTFVKRTRDVTFQNTTTIGPALFTIAAGAAFLGRKFTGGDYLDAMLSSFHIWARQLSPLEQDFMWKTIDEDNVSFATNLYAPVSTERWTDVTGNPGSSQINRLRSDVPQFYKLATVDGGPAFRVQIAASEEGMVKPDVDLVGNLFSLTWTETPGTPPLVTQDVGWSSVFDCVVRVPGHYTARVFREGGGTVFVHFDVEVP